MITKYENTLEVLEELEALYSFVNIDDNKKANKKKLRKIVSGVREKNPKYVKEEQLED
jgi:hypothetical protein